MDSYTPAGGDQKFPRASEDALVRRALEGDAEAFGDLYERYLPQVFRYVYCRIRDVREAEDLTETVFLRVWESLSRFQIGRISFCSWLFRVARNLLIDRYRTWKDVQPLADESIQFDASTSPEERMIAQQRRERIFSAMACLKQDYQDVLTLRFLSGLNHGEVAAILGKSEAAVRVLQHRALQTLMRIMRKKE